MLPREGWNFDDLHQSAHPCVSAKMKTEQVMERAPRRIFAAIF